MKKIYLFSLLLANSMSIHGQSLTVENCTAPANSEVTIKIATEGITDSYIATGMVLQLAEGMTIVSDESGSLVTANAGMVEDHTIKAMLNDNKLKFAIYSPTNSEMTLYKDFVTLQLKTPSKGGTYQCKLSNIEFSTGDFQLLTLPDVSFHITVQQSQIGDVNGDGKVTIQDAMSIVNYIMGNPSTAFDISAADVNADGNITITDAVSVVNIILNSSADYPSTR